MASAEPGAPSGDVTVELAWSPAPRDVRVVSLRLAGGATVAAALRASGCDELAHAARDDAAFAAAGLSTAVWGRACALDQALRHGDRVEVLRALDVAPMEARRARYEAAGGVDALRQRSLASQRRRR